ncbi:MAG: hypothetical protein DHS20C01_25230 [marine bacterium B5-7]|nr:MAG: hypothetical protein DHS20C01_25230 [marine bacterium B5-7]
MRFNGFQATSHAIILIFTLTLAGNVLAQQDNTPSELTSRQVQMEHKFEKAKTYYGECKHTEAAEFDEIRPYLKGFTDVEVLSELMANPVSATRLMQIVSDPRTIHVMMKCSTEPVMWDTWMRGMTDFSKMMRASMIFMNPMTYLNWMMAPVNPSVYSAMFGMVSPENLDRWGTALVNPEFYQPMVQPLTSLDWYSTRLAWIADPESYAPLIDLLRSGFTPATVDQPME